jgi:hypothetical protein
MWRRLVSLSPIVLGIGVVVCWALFMFLPAVPSSLAGWLALVFVGLPLLFAGELLATWVFDRPFLKKWPTVARLFFGVVALLALITVLAPALIFTQRLIAS